MIIDIESKLGRLDNKSRLINKRAEQRLLKTQKERDDISKKLQEKTKELELSLEGARKCAQNASKESAKAKAVLERVTRGKNVEITELRSQIAETQGILDATKVKFAREEKALKDNETLLRREKQRVQDELIQKKFQHEEVTKELNQLKIWEQTAKASLAQLRRNNSDRVKKIKELQEKLANQERTLEEKDSQLSDLESKFRRLDNESKLMNEQANQRLSEKESELERLKEESEEALKKKDSQLLDLESKFGRLDNRSRLVNERAKQRLLQKESELERLKEESEKALENAKNTYEQAIVKKLEQQTQEYNVELGNLRKDHEIEKTELQRRYDTLQKLFDGIRAENTNYEQQLNIARERSDSAEKNAKRLQELLNTAVTGLEQKNKELKTRREELRTRGEKLKKMRTNYMDADRQKNNLKITLTRMRTLKEQEDNKFQKIAQKNQEIKDLKMNF